MPVRHYRAKMFFLRKVVKIKPDVNQRFMLTINADPTPAKLFSLWNISNTELLTEHHSVTTRCHYLIKFQIRNKIQLWYFFKNLKINLRIIFPNYFLLLEEHITQKMLIIFSVSLPNTNFSEILFSYQLQLNEK